MVVLVYVDDIIITGASSTAINVLKNHWNTIFKLKDLGSLRYFLGLELARSSKGILLSQWHYLLQLLEDTGLLSSNPSLLPMDPHVKLSATEGTLLTDVITYHRLIGRLVYLTVSRPDITFVVHKLSQFVASPCQPHLAAAYTLRRYLKGSLLVKGFSFQLLTPYSCVPLQMSTGHLVLFPENQLLVLVFSWEMLLSLGSQRSKILCLDHLLKQNTEPSLLPLVN